MGKIDREPATKDFWKSGWSNALILCLVVCKNRSLSRREDNDNQSLIGQTGSAVGTVTSFTDR